MAKGPPHWLPLIHSQLADLPQRLAAAVLAMNAQQQGQGGSFSTDGGGGGGGDSGEGENYSKRNGKPDVYGASQRLFGNVGNFLPGFGKIAQKMGQVRSLVDAAQNLHRTLNPPPPKLPPPKKPPSMDMGKLKGYGMPGVMTPHHPVRMPPPPAPIQNPPSGPGSFLTPPATVQPTTPKFTDPGAPPGPGNLGPPLTPLPPPASLPPVAPLPPGPPSWAANWKPPTPVPASSAGKKPPVLPIRGPGKGKRKQFSVPMRTASLPPPGYGGKVNLSDPKYRPSPLPALTGGAKAESLSGGEDGGIGVKTEQSLRELLGTSTKNKENVEELIDLLKKFFKDSEKKAPSKGDDKGDKKQSSVMKYLHDLRRGGPGGGLGKLLTVENIAKIAALFA